MSKEEPYCTICLQSMHPHKSSYDLVWKGVNCTPILSHVHKECFESMIGKDTK